MNHFPELEAGAEANDSQTVYNRGLGDRPNDDTGWLELLLDFGLVGRLTRVQQEALVTMIVAVALRDPDSVARVLNRIGVPDAP